MSVESDSETRATRISAEGECRSKIRPTRPKKLNIVVVRLPIDVSTNMQADERRCTDEEL